MSLGPVLTYLGSDEGYVPFPSLKNGTTQYFNNFYNNVFIIDSF